MTRINQEGIDIIKEFESFSATPYPDPVGIMTIGFGHVILPGEKFAEITPDEGQKLLMRDLVPKETWVNHYITAPLNDNQFSALVSLVFNVGVTPLTKTLGRKLNARDYLGAAGEFDRWVHAGGEVLEGLVRRRAAEKRLFLKPVVV